MEETIKKCLLVGADQELKKELTGILKCDNIKLSSSAKKQNIYSSLKKGFSVALLDMDDLKDDLVELIEGIQFTSPHVPIIVLSSDKKYSTAKMLLRYGVYDLVSKPVSKDDLVEAVRHAITENFDRVNKARLLRLAQQRSYNIMLLKEIAESTVKRLDIKILLENIIEMIASLFDVKVVSIMMRDKRKDTLEVSAYKGPRKQYVKDVKIKVGEGVSGFVAKTGEPLLINNISKNNEFSQSNWSKSYTNASLLTVPIKIDDNVIGILNVNNKIDNSEFNDNDKNILMTISNQVAMAIENFRLYSSINEKAKKLEKSNKKLADLSKAKSQLLCNLSHELRTPLTSVIGYLELLLTFTEKDSEEERKNFLSIIHDESLSISQLIDKILNFFNLDTNKIEWDIVPLDLNDVLNEVISKYLPKMEKGGIEFRYLNKLTDIKVQADHKMLSTALEQLFDNAIKFNDDRCKLSLKVEQVREKKASIAKVSIFNTGAQIKRRDVNKIFEDFYQPGSIMTEKPAGLGLGLATTRGILKKLKGTVKLDATDKRGNTFVCSIPLLKGSTKGK